MLKILAQLAAEIRIRPEQVKTAVALLDGGATVPFIARYRKEVTDGLDDIQLRELEARLSYLRELEDRRAAVVKSITEQGKMTPELGAAIDAAPTKQELEDLYLPFKPKRRTKGMIAREVVKTGDIVKVKVLEVDVARKRISLTMKLDAAPARRDGPRDNKFEGAGRDNRQRGGGGGGYTSPPASAAAAGSGSAMASAFAKLQGLKK